MIVRLRYKHVELTRSPAPERPDVTEIGDFAEYKAIRRKTLGMHVASVMTPRTDLVTATLPGSREDVLEELQRDRFSSVPVVKVTDEGEQYRGLVSRERLIEDPDEDQLALLLEEIPAVAPEASIQDLAEHMVAHDIRRVPVVEGGQLAGIVTITDVIRAIAREELPVDAPVGGVAQERVHTTYVKTPLLPAGRGMFYADEAYAIVLGADGDMAGIISEVDIVRVVEVVAGEEGTGDSIANQDSEWAWEGIKAVGNRYLPTRNVEFPDATVEECMTEDVVTVSGQLTVTETAQRLVSNDIEQAPLLRGDQLVGVVKDMHLLVALYE